MHYIHMVDTALRSFGSGYEKDNLYPYTDVNK